MKKISEPNFEPLGFTCPICSCRYVAESPADFEIAYDEGDAYLILRCPECPQKDACVVPEDLDQSNYLPAVIRAANAASPRVVNNVKLVKPIKTYCPVCLNVVELTTLNGIYQAHESYFVKCPGCGSAISLSRAGENCSSIIAETLLSIR